MSEFEKRRRAEYKRKRKKCIIAQTAVILLLTLVMLASFIAYQVMNQTYYIEYTENSLVDYKVYLKENDFYEEEYLDKGQSYVASLIDNIKTDFIYRLNMDASDVDYEYSYSVDAELRITDRTSNATIFSSTEVITPENTVAQNSNNKLIINESVDVNYGEYNNLAARFVETYKLTNATSKLILAMRVNVLSSCEEFESDNSNEYVMMLNIPLNSTTLEITMTSSVPSSESKIIASDRGASKDTAKVIAIISAALDALCIIALIIFIFTTRNTDINYNIKVQRILSKYRSYIQKINNPFSSDGYQVLMVDSFREMLEIRDTIQSPILMSENEDKTRTEFIITTNTKILYMYELKVDDYDIIYATPVNVDEAEAELSEETAEVVEESVAETIEEVAEITEETVAEVAEEVAEVVEEPVAEVAEEVAEVVEETVAEVATEVAEVVEETVAEEATEVAEVVEETVAEVTEEVAEVAEEAVAEETTEVAEVVEETVAEVAEEVAEVAEEAVTETSESPAPVNNAEVVTEEAVAQLIAEGDDADSYRIVDGKIVHVRFRTSFMSRLIQAGDEIQRYYTAIKNKLLSYKGVKARGSFHFESFNKGRIQCAKINVKGVALIVNIGLNPNDYDMQKYRLTDVGDKPNLNKVPMQIKVKSQRSLATALRFIEEVMKKNDIPFAQEQNADYSMPYETDEQLVERGLIKIILPGGVEIDENSRIEKLDVGAILNDTKKNKQLETIVIETPNEPTHIYEIEFVSENTVDEELVVAAVAEPTSELADIEYDDTPDEVYEETEGHPGLEVINVVWPERAHKNKIYRYDPNGEKISEGDIVLVPTKDVAQNKEVVRKAIVVQGNHLIEADSHQHSLKKVIAIVRAEKDEETV